MKLTAPKRASAGAPGEHARSLASTTRSHTRSTRPVNAMSRCRKYRKRLGIGDHPLAHRHLGEDVIDQMGCGLGHATRIT